MLLVLGAALLLYSLTMTPGLIVGSTVESESAILQRAAYRLGIAHSTGYPLHTMLGYGAAHLGEALGMDPYSAITFLSVLGAALGAALFYRLGAAISTPWLGLGGALVLMVTAQYWHLATITETQALNAVVVFGLLGCAWWHLRAPESFYPLAGVALLAGIGLANHRTVVLTLPAVGVAVLLTGALWRLRPRQWLALVVLGVLPLLSYGYLFLRAGDPDVAFGIRPPFWDDPPLTSADVVAHIRGTFSDGGGLEGNMQLPSEDFGERWRYVVGVLRDDLTAFGLAAGVLGGLVSVIAPEDRARRRFGWVLWLHSAVWVFFLMTWRLDKAIIYHFALSGAVLLALLSGLGAGLARLSGRWRGAAEVVAGGVLLACALALYNHNIEAQDRSDDTRGAVYYEAMSVLPHGAHIYTGGWSAETFILLEYMQDQNRRDIIPHAAREPGDISTAAAEYQSLVYVVPFTRAYLGWYEGRLNIQQDMALAATDSNLILRVLPRYDGRLYEEGRNATRVEVPITPTIDLFSYDLTPTPEGVRVTLFWLASQDDPIQARYSVFTHLRLYDAAGQPVALLAGDDNYIPVENSYPTDLWALNEIVKDTYFLACPAQPMPRERVRLAFGMTETATGERVGQYVLPVTDVPALDDWACLD